MSDKKTPTGSIGWVDLTVEDAPKIRDFYKSVVGWESEGVSMGDYEDFTMMPPNTKSPVAGICHARGANADLPPQWMVYLIVADLDASMKAVTEGGGEIIAGPKDMGSSRYCVIKDPQGAVAALYQE